MCGLDGPCSCLAPAVKVLALLEDVRASSCEGTEYDVLALSVAGLKKCDPVPAGYHIEAVRECVRLSTFPSPCHPLEIVGHIEVDPPRALLGPEAEGVSCGPPLFPIIPHRVVLLVQLASPQMTSMS